MGDLFAVLGVALVGPGMTLAVRPSGPVQIFSLQAASFAAALRRVSLAMGDRPGRYDLEGVLLEGNAAKLTLIATDAARLAVAQPPAKQVGGNPTVLVQAFLTREGVGVLQNALDRADGDCTLELSSEKIVISGNGRPLEPKLPRVNFPAWREHLPDSTDRAHIEVSARALLAALERVAPGNSVRDRSSVWTLANGRLQIDSTLAAPGRAASELAVPYHQPPLSVYLDPRWILPFLRVLDPAGAVGVSFRGETDAVLFSAAEGCQYAVMPLGPE